MTDFREVAAKVYHPPRGTPWMALFPPEKCVPPRVDGPITPEPYRVGKTTVIGFFVGQIMKATKGQASPGMMNDLLKAKLG